MAVEAVSGDAEARDNGNERTPLLNHSLEEPCTPEQRPKAKDIRFRALALLYATVTALAVSMILQDAPAVRLVEIFYCRRFYEEHNPDLMGDNGVVDEEYCKIDVVQSQVAFLKGWLSFFKYLPAVFLAVPYGILADRYGRKYMLLVNIVSYFFQSAWFYFVCSIPQLDIRLVWLQAVLQLFGGGLMVMTALLFVIANDITPKSDTSTTFFRITAVYLLSYVLFPPVSGLLMKRDPWLPMKVGLVIQLIAIPIIIALPETLGVVKEDEVPLSDELNEDRSHNDLSPSPDVLSIDLEKPSFLGLILKPFIYLCHNYRFLFQDWRLLFLLFLFPIRMMTNSLDELLIQYVPKRYFWSFAQATYIWSFQYGISVITLLLLLPIFSSYLLRHKSFSPASKDLLIMRLSFVAVAFGYLLEGLAPSIYILFLGALVANLGAGLGASMRALLTTYVHKDEVAKLYTALAITETIGMSLGGPLTAWLFKAGMAREGSGGGRGGEQGGSRTWLGLPWLVLALSLSLGATGTWILRLQGSGVEKINIFQDDPEDGGIFAEGLERANEVPGSQGAQALGIN